MEKQPTTGTDYLTDAAREQGGQCQFNLGSRTMVAERLKWIPTQESFSSFIRTVAYTAPTVGNKGKNTDSGPCDLGISDSRFGLNMDQVIC